MSAIADILLIVFLSLLVADETASIMKGVVNMVIVKFFMKLGLGFLGLLFGMKTIFEAGEMTGAAKVASKLKDEDPEAFDRVIMEEE